MVEITRADSQATGPQRRRPSGGLGVDSKAPSEIQTPAASRSDIARMLFLARMLCQLDRPSWLELKGYVFAEGKGPNRGQAPHRFRLVWADVLPWKAAN